MHYNLSTKVLRDLLSTPAYKATSYQSTYNPDFEALSDYGNIKGVFDDLLTKLNRPPSQKEYIEEGMKRAEAFFQPNNKSKTTSIHSIKRKGSRSYTDAYFYWNKDLQSACRGRLARTYPSYMVEYSTIIALKELYPEFQIGSNTYVDTVFGADIVVASKALKKCFYIHIISNTPTSRGYLKEKAKRTGYCMDMDGNSKYFKRDWTKGHFELAYDRSNTANTEVINGNPILTHSYITGVIEAQTLFSETDDFTKQNQICQFHYWLVQNNVAKEGLKDLWVK